MSWSRGRRSPAGVSADVDGGSDDRAVSPLASPPVTSPSSLLRQPTTEHSINKGRSDIVAWISGLGDGVHRISSSWTARGLIARSPSPNRHRLVTSPTPSVTGTNTTTVAATTMASTSAATTMASTSASTLASTSASALATTNGTPTLSSPSMRPRCRSPMLASLNKLSSGASSTTTWSSSSLGSSTSLSAPLGALQPELYRRETMIVLENYSNVESGSLEHDSVGDSSSATSAATSTLAWSSGNDAERQRAVACPTIGRLHFRLSYDFNKSDLLVHLIEVRDLTLKSESSGGSTSSSSGSGSVGSAGQGGRDAHIRVCLAPAVDRRRRQSALRHSSTSSSNSNDVDCFIFDEHFKFPVSHDNLTDKTLLFQVCDYDRFSRPCVIGDLQLALADRDVAVTVDIWGDIVRNTQPDEERPQLLVSLGYLPSAERLTVVVLKAKNLTVPANKDTIDPQVKLYLMINGKRIKKKKTEVRKGTENPVWNQAVAFTVPASKLHGCSLEILIVDHCSDRGGKAAALGCVVLGPDQNQTERQHWQDMAHNVRKSIAMWHTLR